MFVEDELYEVSCMNTTCGRMYHFQGGFVFVLQVSIPTGLAIPSFSIFHAAGLVREVI